MQHRLVTAAGAGDEAAPVEVLSDGRGLGCEKRAQEVSMGTTAKSAMNCWFIDNNEKLCFSYQKAKFAKMNGLVL